MAETVCKICGYTAGAEHAAPICPCCAAESGVDDVNRNVARLYRTDWLLRGAHWLDETARPDGWQVEEAIARIPENFR